MKKLCLVAVFAIISMVSVNAQENESTSVGGFEQGDVFISGSAGFETTKFGDAKTNGFTFSPSLGYFVSDNIAVEFGLTIGSAENESEVKATTFGAQLGANYFFTPENAFSFTLGAGLGYSTSKTKFGGNESPKTNIIAFAVSPGLNYFVSDAFALRASIGALSYASAKLDIDGAEASNAFGLNLDLSDIEFGVIYKF